MNIGERVKRARQFIGLNQTDIAEILGIQSSFLSNIERSAKSPPKKLIELLSSRYKINANWILTGEGDMTIEKTSTKAEPLVGEIEKIVFGVTSPKFSEIEDRLARLESRLEKQNILEGNFTAEAAPEYDWETEKVNKIPFVYDIAAGPPIAQSEDQSETIAVPIRLMRKGVQYYAATVRGGSMEEAGIRDGDLVLIRCTNVPRDGAIQVVRYQDKSTLKLLREVEGKGWELHYRDGTGRVITCDSNEYETQGEFEAIITKKRAKKPGSK